MARLLPDSPEVLEIWAFLQTDGTVLLTLNDHVAGTFDFAEMVEGAIESTDHDETYEEALAGLGALKVAPLGRHSIRRTQKSTRTTRSGPDGSTSARRLKMAGSVEQERLWGTDAIAKAVSRVSEAQEEQRLIFDEVVRRLTEARVVVDAARELSDKSASSMHGTDLTSEMRALRCSLKEFDR